MILGDLVICIIGSILKNKNWKEEHQKNISTSQVIGDVAYPIDPNFIIIKDKKEGLLRVRAHWNFI